jgi:hypothetical protein
LDCLKVVRWAGASRDRKALAGFCILDLKDSARAIKMPTARQIAIAIKLDCFKVVRWASASCDRQALAGLRIHDLKGAALAIKMPTARQISIAIKLDCPQIVRWAGASCDSQALAGFAVYQQFATVGGTRGVEWRRCEQRCRHNKAAEREESAPLFSPSFSIA